MSQTKGVSTLQKDNVMAFLTVVVANALAAALFVLVAKRNLAYRLVI